jgi:hypothetical protein
MAHYETVKVNVEKAEEEGLTPTELLDRHLPRRAETDAPRKR